MSGSLATVWRSIAVLGLALTVTACASTDENAPYSGGSALAVQPFPANYRADILAFMRTYLNNPQAVHEAVIAEPVQRSVGSQQRYVACVRYVANGQGDAGSGERAVIFLDGRLERLIEKGRELCAGATYQPFPEMEKLTR